MGFKFNIFEGDWREKYRVRIGFIFGVLFIWRAQPRNMIVLAIGLLTAFAGILLRQWSAGCVKKMDEVSRTGPYGIVRHPLYLGSFLAAAGFIFSASWVSLALQKPYLDRTLLYWCFLWALCDSIYVPKIMKEEENLKAKFPGQYEEYMKSVPRFIPGSLSQSNFDFSTFSLELWKKNEEYWSIAGYLMIALVLVARYIYR